jgi:hypothetical protein
LFEGPTRATFLRASDETPVVTTPFDASDGGRARQAQDDVVLVAPRRYIRRR